MKKGMINPFNGSKTVVKEVVNQKRISLEELIERHGGEVEDYNEYYTLLVNGVLIRHSVPEKAMYDPSRT